MDAETRFRALFDSAYPALRRYAHHRGLNGADGEDLVAATLEVAWRKIEDVPHDDPLPWLYVVAHNLWRNQRRRDRHRGELVERLAATPQPTSEDPADLHPDALRTAMAALAEDDQEVLRLVAWDGLTPAQAATVLGCTPVAARSRLHRARNRLAERLGLDPRLQRAGAARHKQGDGFDLEEVSDER